MSRQTAVTFRSLKRHNYRLWAAGALVSNIGTGVQRTAQDWLVLVVFALNFPIFISTMAVGVFHADARGFGALSSVMAIGALAGVLWTARKGRPTLATLLWSAALLGVGFTLASVAPSYWLFAAALAVIGVACLTFVNATNPLMQLSTEPAMRGRVMALRVSVALGATPVGAPIVGWVADRFGPRWALGIGAAAGFAAAAVGLYARLRATNAGAQRG